MEIPQYVTKEEVRRICKELKISDWTRKNEAKVSLKEAKVILAQVNTKGMDIILTSSVPVWKLNWSMAYNLGMPM